MHSHPPDLDQIFEELRNRAATLQRQMVRFIFPRAHRTARFGQLEPLRAMA
jgi:hypothetical protein